MMPGALQRIRELLPFWREDAARAELELGHLQAELVADAAYHGVPTWRASGAAEVAAPGLVSVPTTCTRRCSRPSRSFRVAAQASAAREVIGVFQPDPAASRLARLRRGVGAAARCLDVAAKPEAVRTVMVTLTYRGTNADWSPNHIRAFLAAVREWMRRRDLAMRYVWVAELQKRGVIHYHVALWLPEGVQLPKPDERGWWPHGMTRTEWARHAVGYIAKYASKGTDDVIPKGVRLYGVGGLVAQDRLVRAWWNLPVGVRRWGFPADRWRRAAGGGWVCRASGEWRASLWSVQLVAGRVFAFPRPQPIQSPFDALLQALSAPWQRMRF